MIFVKLAANLIVINVSSPVYFAFSLHLFFNQEIGKFLETWRFLHVQMQSKYVCYIDFGVSFYALYSANIFSVVSSTIVSHNSFALAHLHPALTTHKLLQDFVGHLILSQLSRIFISWSINNTAEAAISFLIKFIFIWASQ